LSLVRQMRGGKDYDPEWNSRMTGQGPIAELIAARFRAAKKRLGLEREHLSLDVSKFQVPPKSGDQMDLFAS
jgi:DNA repair photolyase